MNTSIYRLAFMAGMMVLALDLGGCASYRMERKADRLVMDEGQTIDSIRTLETFAKTHNQYRGKYLKKRESFINRALQDAQQLRRQGMMTEASGRYQDVLALEPLQSEAQRGLEEIAREQRQATGLKDARQAIDARDTRMALRLLHDILAENPQHAEARQLRQSLELQQNRENMAELQLKPALTKAISLEFRNASLQAVFDVLTQSVGINFIFDRDVKMDARTTLFARDTSADDVLKLLLRTNQLRSKVLNDSTLLIYPATPEKERQYEDLIVRSFYLDSIDPARVQDMIRNLINPKFLYVDEKLKLLTVRDNMNMIDAVERLIAVYDLVGPEVNLDIEIMEVNSDKLLNLGIQYPDQIRASVQGSAGVPGKLTVDEFRNLNKGNFSLTLPDPLAVLNFRQTMGAAKVLANPRIRVQSREKASVLIGDRVPVITSTINQNSNAITESISYLDVGLKLLVEPEVHVNNDVSINVALEVSNIVKEIRSTTGLLTYQIGTRNASTVLRLKDGETQVLAGLIRHEDHQDASHLPGLGKLPVLGKLFSNETNTRSKSEIVLLITPHVMRSLHTPAANIMEFMSGTGNQVSNQPLQLRPAGRYSTQDSKLLEGATDRALPRASPPAVGQPESKKQNSGIAPASVAPPAPVQASP